MFQPISKVGGDSELGVENQVLYRELDYVGDTLTGAVVFGKQFEIIDRIVSPVSVFVVDGFFLAKRPAEMLFHHIAMFQNVARRVSVFARNYQAHVAVLYQSACDGVVRVFLLVGDSPKQRSAFSAAQVLAAVDSSARSPLDNHTVSALNADVVPSFFRKPPPDSSTFGRAVHGVFAPLFVVRGDLRRLHAEQGVADFAREIDRRDLRGGAPVFRFMLDFAAKFTEALSRVRRLYAESSSALFAVFLDRHLGFSVVGGDALTSVARTLVQVNRRT